MSDALTTAAKHFWTDAPWDAWPPVRFVREEAMQDGEASRQREIERLLRRIKGVKAVSLGVVEYNPHEAPPDDQD